MPNFPGMNQPQNGSGSGNTPPNPATSSQNTATQPTTTGGLPNQATQTSPQQPSQQPYHHHPYHPRPTQPSPNQAPPPMQPHFHQVPPQQQRAQFPFMDPISMAANVALPFVNYITNNAGNGAVQNPFGFPMQPMNVAPMPQQHAHTSNQIPFGGLRFTQPASQFQQQQQAQQPPPPNDVFMAYQPPSASGSGPNGQNLNSQQNLPPQQNHQNPHQNQPHVHYFHPQGHHHIHVHAMPRPPPNQVHSNFNPASAAFPPTPILYPLLHMPPHASVSAHGNMPANGQQPVHQNMQNMNGQQQQPGFHVHHQVFHPHGLQVHFNVSGAHPHHHHGPPQDTPHAASGSEQFGQNQPNDEVQQNQQQLPRPQPVRRGFNSDHHRLIQFGVNPPIQVFPHNIPQPVPQQFRPMPHQQPQQGNMPQPIIDFVNAITGGPNDVNVEIRVINGNGPNGNTTMLTGRPPTQPTFDASGAPVRIVWENGGMMVVPGDEEPIAEFINNLLNMFHVQPMQVGILPDHLRNLPMTSVNDKQVEDKAQCAVCLEFYSIEEKVAVLGCRHMFHRDCLEPWLKNKASCPVCRVDVNPYDWPGNERGERRADQSGRNAEQAGPPPEEQNHDDSGQSNQSQPSDTSMNMQDMDLD
ncbi:hypothetical protein WR25_00602 [Diploscapter pachys]|uniref:RING-type domain-containing protein n=1 Tax=Diploscapter pachys TaxID=2018661 RepID=A0A2A2KI75_9BILA|nr:hypothetical protein WR25_00602 [Diploscapter pachys]